EGRAAGNPKFLEEMRREQGWWAYQKARVMVWSRKIRLNRLLFPWTQELQRPDGRFAREVIQQVDGFLRFALFEYAWVAWAMAGTWAAKFAVYAGSEAIHQGDLDPLFRYFPDHSEVILRSVGTAFATAGTWNSIMQYLWDGGIIRLRRLDRKRVVE